MYLQPFNNKFQTYFCVTYQGSGTDTYSDDRSTPSRKASSFFSELVCDNSGPVGPKHGTGVSNRFCVGATPTIPPYSPTSLLSSESADSRGTIQPQPKTSNQTTGVPLGDRLLLQHFPGSQKEWGTEAGEQPQSSEPVCSPRTFQNGGHTHLEGPDETRGLVGKDRPQGCLSGDPDRPDTQRHLRFQFVGKTYHFTCLPFGLSSVPWVFTKTLKPALALLRARGVRLIHRQHIGPSRVERTIT